MNDAAADPASQGLSEAEAARRLAETGPNALPEARGQRWRAIVRDMAREPMFVLLLGAAGLYLALGETREGIFLLLMVLAMLGLTLYQQGRTERALQALRELATPTALVVRGGQRRRLPAAELVPGDLVELGEGDRVPADAWLTAGAGLQADESMLTGESVPVAKCAAPGEPPAAVPGGDGSPWVYAGTLVVQGHGLARVARTGVHSELGRIGSALHAIRPPPSRLQGETGDLARRLALLGAAVSLFLILILRLRGGPWLESMLAGVALSMSVLPEEFPVVLTVFPALGAWRLARMQVLTRRLAAIEILGSTSVLCVDKTGTLTENRMAVHALWCEGRQVPLAGSAPLAPPCRELLRFALLASRPNASDPMESAFERAARARLAADALAPPGPLVREYGITPTRPALIHVWADGGALTAAIKGAPETVAAMCGLGAAQAAAVLAAAAAMAAEGLRVLAVGRARAPAALPDDPADLPFELLGLAALADPLRADIPDAVADCRAAGMRILMITGDHPATAQAIAHQAGLGAGSVLTGAEMAAMDDALLQQRLAGAAVCARIVPRQKLRIVQALQRAGEVVAMTGDGVNDAPALRAADVGVAMGLRGTDVAREAAELTLLDDRFASLVQAVRAGRRIYSNMRKSMAYVMAIHVPIAGMALLPVLLGWPVLLYPVHIVFLELVIDPACSLAFESEPDEPGLMRRPPRARAERLFGRVDIHRAVLAGGWSLLLTVLAYGYALEHLPEAQARAFAFAVMVLCNLGLLLLNRQGRLRDALRAANPVFWAIAALAPGLLLAAVYIPSLASLFRFAAPPLTWIAMAALLALGMLAGAEAARRLAAQSRA
ncbi:cation-translocating P-type ATPase [Massilia jejuensis]|uniref:Cation-translocating P-type ATPase n=1 Tax=Massilia jejuensis TaxID=648894 RepID=A0ABW0PJL2_9BURK